ncbi:MAG: hypothetical protein ACREQR_02620 [Candidatus Binataceae bacterium]
MRVPIYVGPIAAATIGWQIYQYGDWVAAIGVLIIYIGYRISLKVFTRIVRAEVREPVKPKWWDEEVGGLPHPTDQSVEARRIRASWQFRWFLRPRCYPPD